MVFQEIFRDRVVDQMYMDVRNCTSIESYRNAEFEIDPNKILRSSIAVPDELPHLGPKPTDDVESAISLYEYLGPLDSTQASDRRLWTYLAHVTFRDYMMQRWKIDDDAAKAKTSILDHWFVSENDRRLRRHGLARLWWAANLTVAPWDAEPGSFIALRNEDNYIYTRILLSSQDIFLQVLERSIGRSRKILIALLEAFRRNDSLAKDRSAVRDLIKETNLVCGYNKLPSLSFDQVFQIISGLWAGTSK